MRGEKIKARPGTLRISPIKARQAQRLSTKSRIAIARPGQQMVRVPFAGERRRGAFVDCASSDRVARAFTDDAGRRSEGLWRPSSWANGWPTRAGATACLRAPMRTLAATPGHLETPAVATAQRLRHTNERRGGPVGPVPAGQARLLIRGARDEPPGWAFFGPRALASLGKEQDTGDEPSVDAPRRLQATGPPTTRQGSAPEASRRARRWATALFIPRLASPASLLFFPSPFHP
ncbi:hypothetical protein K491DRAFT_170853 [Lophiostoma macrostomum CBS 122681]|uniref:Uncharacterized protein n=1 Tax=Lophiostoma macrostomum CBS 122681 TaxID=1314788 RepID=A0A6A6SQH7_9PLEO|nr:hypothetical protein K491DRAFT_170853 [Lophiostoma macrostomum CBS 122681]